MPLCRHVANLKRWNGCCGLVLKFGFHYSAVGLGILVTRAAMGQVFLQVRRFFLLSMISAVHQTRISFIYHRHYKILANDSAIK